MMNTAEAVVAYAAGLFDGEGTIIVEQAQGGNTGRGRNVAVRVSNTNPDVVAWLRDNFGGFVTQAYEAKGNRKACFVWCIKARKAEDFLRLVKPYLIVKKRQALIALILRRIKNSTGSKYDFTEDQMKVEKFLAELMVTERSSPSPSKEG